jgi:predicted Fe-Mo cluster-binding NifX family protein
MGRIAIPTWNGRISPVFDTALRLLLVDVGERGEHSRFEIGIGEPFLPGKTMRLTELRVDTLICGAISGQFAQMITSAGIELIPWISGPVEDVLKAFLRGDLFDMQFLMPGRPDYWGRDTGRGYGRGRGRRRRGVPFHNMR